ncbi:uncharacterized protein TNCV_1265271 [Trichonephila clavipes]|nr:uncharacterized protein TNCV_1265271 [Trichonephila clavipes]
MVDMTPRFVTDCVRISSIFFRKRSTLNSRRAACPLVKLVEREERWEAPDYTQGVLSQNWGETELNRTVSCLLLKATDNDRRHLALCHGEFRGP